jgi:hypothetical protein
LNSANSKTVMAIGASPPREYASTGDCAEAANRWPFSELPLYQIFTSDFTACSLRPAARRR